MENNKIEVWFDEENICLLFNGKLKKHPLSWFPRLEGATESQRMNYTLSPFGLHWNSLDEDLSFEGFDNFILI